jgi:hypothetical protein
MRCDSVNVHIHYHHSFIKRKDAHFNIHIMALELV